MQNLKPVEDFLIECAGLNLDPFTHVALARYRHMRDDQDGALHEIKRALALDPSFWEARKLMGEILLATSRDREALAAYRELIGHLNIPYLKFQCTNCGFRPPDLLWQCPQCRKWDTMTRMDGQPVPSVTSLTPPKLDEIKHRAPWEDKT
jgi:lipopolysaccharide biosynthesis regulator YciM